MDKTKTFHAFELFYQNISQNFLKRYGETKICQNKKNCPKHFYAKCDAPLNPDSKADFKTGNVFFSKCKTLVQPAGKLKKFPPEDIKKIFRLVLIKK